MGIYDREYYRGESRGPGFFATAPVCKWLIIINVAVFLAEQTEVFGPDFLGHWFAARADTIFRQGRIWQLLTATFLHADVLHLIGNMLFLWFVGREIESMYGARDFLAFYLSAAIFSTFVWAAAHEFVPRHGGNPDVRMIGASGAVLAVVVLYALFFPRREVMFMFVIPVEMWLLVTLFIIYQVVLLLKGGTIEAVESHLAGVAYGYLFRRFDLRWSHMPWSRARRPRLRVVTGTEPREKPAARPSATSKPSWATNTASLAKPVIAVIAEEQLDARLDEVLAKIAREGREALSEDENRILQEASRRARNRRSEKH